MLQHTTPHHYHIACSLVVIICLLCIISLSALLHLHCIISLCASCIIPASFVLLYADTEYYTVSFGPATIQTQFAVLACDGPGVTTVNMDFTAPIVYREVTENALTLTLDYLDVFQVSWLLDIETLLCYQ